MLFLERSGYTEETFHTFSYSPLFDDHGAAAGMLCVVSEDTEDFIANRRMQTLRDLARGATPTSSWPRPIATACQELADSPADLPFSLVYLHDDEADVPRLVGSTGFDGAHPAGPPELGRRRRRPSGRSPRVWPVRPSRWPTSPTASPTSRPAPGSCRRSRRWWCR